LLSFANFAYFAALRETGFSAGGAHVTTRFVVLSAPPDAVDPEPAQANMSRFELLTALRC